MHDLLYKIAITKIPLVGAVTAKNLISYCGGVRAVFEARKKDLLRIPGVGEQTANHILHQNVLNEAEIEIDFIEKNEIKPLFYLDKDYPSRLKSYRDCPVLLFYKGNVDLNRDPIIGIVGTRKPSPHGLSNCEELIEDLKKYNPIILSGLAFGIDITAHRKSLEIDLDTVGVLGHGLGRIYPPQHRKVAMEMIEQGGLLTEYPSNVNPDRENFPMRNRIVAGLCDGLVVIETALKGGSVITANYARSYNKDVFAIPGRLKDKASIGCNYLIKTNQAKLIENAEDIAQTLHWQNADNKAGGIQPKLFIDLSEKEKMIIDLIQEEEEAGIDKLTFDSKISYSEIASLLLELEFKGLVRPLPGKRYILV